MIPYKRGESHLLSDLNQRKIAEDPARKEPPIAIIVGSRNHTNTAVARFPQARRQGFTDAGGESGHPLAVAEQPQSTYNIVEGADPHRVACVGCGPGQDGEDPAGM